MSSKKVPASKKSSGLSKATASNAVNSNSEISISDSSSDGKKKGKGKGSSSSSSSGSSSDTESIDIGERIAAALERRQSVFVEATKLPKAELDPEEE